MKKLAIVLIVLWVVAVGQISRGAPLAGAKAESMPINEADRLANRMAKDNRPLDTSVLIRLLLADGKGGESYLFDSDYFNQHPERVARELVPLLKHPEARVRARAATIFADFGPKLRAAGRGPEESFRNVVPKLVQESNELVDSLRANLGHSDASVRWTAADALVATKMPAASEVVPLAVRWLQDSAPPRESSSFAPNRVKRVLSADPQLAAKLVLQAVPEASAEVRGRLAIAVSTLPCESLPHSLAAALRADDPRLCGFAMQVFNTIPFWELDKIMPSIARDLDSVLASPHGALRLGAADLLARAKDADPARLVTISARGLEEKDVKLRLQAIEILSKLGKPASAAKDALRKRLTDDEPLVRLRVSAVLVRLDRGNAESVLPVLQRMISDRNASTIREALHLVGTMRERAQPLAEELAKLASDSTSPHAMEAAKALLLVDPKQSEVALRTVQKSVRAVDRNLDTRAIEVIRLLGPAARPLLPDLARIHDKERGWRQLSWAVTIALVDRMGETVASAKVRQALTGEDERGYRRDDVLFELETAGPAARGLLPELKVLLMTEDSSVDAINVVRAIGPDARDLLPLLRTLLRGESVALREASARAIRSIEE